jgi:hypothetical protein
MNVRNIVVAAVMVVLAIASPRADIIEQVLVKVNGEIITKTDLEARQVAALRQKNPNLRPESDAALKAALVDVTPAVIVDAVDEMLMVQRGKELGYTMSTERFNSIVENIKKENKIESDEQLQAALKQNMTMICAGSSNDDDGAAGAAVGNHAKTAGHRHELKTYYDAQRWSHRAANHAARNHDQRAGDRAGRQRGAGR